MTRNNNRFANRETTVKGVVINLDTQTHDNFEVKTQYTRSNEKAVAYARKAMQIDDNPMIIVAVTELVNEAPKPVKYDNDKIYEMSYAHFDGKDDAQKAAETDGTEMRVITWYEISAQIWAIDDGGNYITEWYADETSENMTKRDAREFVRMSYEDMNGFKVIGIHDCKKDEKPMYCVITTANLAKCVES